MLFTLQRYEFFSKSQLVPYNTIFHGWCCLPYKGTNFSANHNAVGARSAYFRDVVYPTKVRIFQQITTKTSMAMYHPVMLFTLQRYEFFSKSQHYRCLCCCLWDVVYPTKVRIFQQITTAKCIWIGMFLMLFTLQRYEFFSKSQPICQHI